MIQNGLKLVALFLFASATLIAGSSYTVNTGSQAGTVTDNTTGLKWTRCPLLSSSLPDETSDCSGTPGGFIWADAITACEGLNYAESSTWRLPNVRELQSIVTNYRRYYPQSNPEAFPVVGGDLWSSTTHKNGVSFAWMLYHPFGTIGWRNKNDSKLARCVTGP